ncbi:MAG: LLM class flavin-dependent oxidoreductase [Actinomycetota bacterium]|nr:LLM class flavin-dependent oxidoreductase [Actinomycetota bacterium]
MPVWRGLRARSTKLKLGTTIVAPGRNVVRLAKALADVDALSEGRLLVTLVPDLGRPPERSAIGPPPAERGAILDDAPPLLRRLWGGEEVTHLGPAGDLMGVRLARLPVQAPLEPWLGGLVPASLCRCGRLADGWLPSGCTPADALGGRQVIDEAAEAAGRRISPEHFGVSIGYSTEPLDGPTRAAVESRSHRRRAEETVPVGYPALRSLLEQFVACGFSKFVVRPLASHPAWDRELEDLYSAVGDLQT